MQCWRAMTDHDPEGHDPAEIGRLAFRSQPSRGTPGGREVPLGIGAGRDGHPVRPRHRGAQRARDPVPARGGR